MAAMKITGGCLCGALRYEADEPPSYAGHCYCADCRHASGSGFIPFMGFDASVLRVTGTGRPFHSPSIRGTDATRNFCGTCGGLVYGGELNKDAVINIYAGSLDDPRNFQPKIAIFTRDRPDWVPMPEGLICFETMPP